MDNQHWRDAKGTSAALDLSPLEKKIAEAHSHADMAHTDVAKLADLIAETESIALQKIREVDGRLDAQVTALKKDVGDQVQAVGVSMSEVMKKSLFDQKAIRDEFGKAIADTKAQILAQIPQFDMAFVKNKVASIEGDLTILHSLEQAAVAAHAQLQKEFAERADGLEQVIANLQLPLPVKQNQWPAYIAALLALLGIALHFVP